MGGRWREALSLIRADKLFSTIYIAGTAVAIASAMVVAIFFNILVADIEPESNRSQTLYILSAYSEDPEQPVGYSLGFSTEAIDSCFRKMKSVEAVVGYSQNIFHQDNRISDVEKMHELPVTFIPTNADFFRLYHFTFLSGRPFSEQEFQRGEAVCVVSDKMAKMLAVDTGSSVLLENKMFHIVGVVKTVSSLMTGASADVYLPYNVEGIGIYNYTHADISYFGHLDVMILLRKGYTRQNFIDELEPARKRYEAVQSNRTGKKFTWKLLVNSHLYRYISSLTLGKIEHENTATIALSMMPIVLLMLLFLLLPAVNLSGLVSNRMEARRAEMGIRKAFGAKRRWLLREVIEENMLLTLMGGAVGWILSWVFISLARDTRVFRAMIISEDIRTYDFSLDPAMFLTPTLFIICFLCCAVLNLMAALIPAWRSLRKPIVESLNQKR